MTQVRLPSWVRSPHPELRRPDVLAQMVTALLLWGNAYAVIIRDDRERIQALIPVEPSRVTCDFTDPLQKVERYYQIDGGARMKSYNIMHVQGPTLPGKPTGLSVIAQAREAIGLGQVLEEFGAKYFGQGSLAKVVINHPDKLDREQARQLALIYEQSHKGPSNWHRPAVASGGSTIQQLTIPPEDAQFLQSREFQALDIARWFRVTPSSVGIISKETSWGSGLAEQNTNQNQRTFRPWIARFESAFTAYTGGAATGEDQGVLIRFDDSALQRGSFNEQAKTQEGLFAGGLVTRNEARRALGLGRVDGGDEFLLPASTTVDNGEDPEPQPDPQQEPQNQPDEQPADPPAEGTSDTAGGGDQ